MRCAKIMWPLKSCDSAFVTVSDLTDYRMGVLTSKYQVVFEEITRDDLILNFTLWNRGYCSLGQSKS